MPPPTTAPAAAAATDGDLLERADDLARLDHLLSAVRAERRGGLVLVGGEAGIGKSALLRAFCARIAADGRARVLAGACDPLNTPRPLGPFVDVAEDVGGQLEEVLHRVTAPGTVAAALGAELHGRVATVLVLEDLHWADEATLDVVRLLARRLEALPALVVATYRDDELDAAHRLRILLGDLPRRSAERIALAPLSPAAVATLAAAGGVDASELHRRTGGNPFFVTEVLAAAGADEVLPATVRDAVLARVARLDPDARALVDAVAIVPPRAEPWLLAALAGGDLAALDAALASGVLRAERDAVGFRHEIARVAVEEALAPHRRVQLHHVALAALAAEPSGRRPDLARLAHHAEAAGDAEAVLRYAPGAGEMAACVGSHREAAAQFLRALEHAGQSLPPARRAELLERCSYECYLTDRMDDAIAARRRAFDEHRAAGDRLREGDARRWLSRLAWFMGDNATAEAEAEQAVEVLEGLPPGRELAMAYSNVAQLRMLASDVENACSWGERAIALAESLGEVEILVHALNNVGTAEMMDGIDGGAAKLEASLELALDRDLQEHVARADTNLGAMFTERRDHAAADRHLTRGLAYCGERDLDAWRLYMLGYVARGALDRGDWDAAAEAAGAVLDFPGVAAPSRITPLSVVGRLRARRGDPDPWPPLDEALELARATGELQRLGIVAGARAEARWLGGDDAAVAAETDAVLALALGRRDRWVAGELLAWRRRAGLRDDVAPAAAAEPYRLELVGDARAATARWRALGCPFDAALAQATGDADEDALRAAVADLQALGARPAAQRAARVLRERGVRDVRHGPRGATRANPAGLTRRELEVLALVAQGLRNAPIADRLFLSERTVAHHVSAILRKLEVGTRGQAGAEAARLGIVRR